jgi:Fur family ferric uptake transcriptional regulator
MPEPDSIMTRSTRQARAVTAILAALPGFRSARQIHAALQAGGEHAGIATVYRHLRLLAEHGGVDTVHGGNGEMLGRRNG